MKCTVGRKNAGGRGPLNLSRAHFCYAVATKVATAITMKAATVRELKNNTSELLRRAATEDVVITSRGRPVACLIGLHEDDITIRPRNRQANYADEKQKKRVFRLLGQIWKMKPDRGKTWISQEHHDIALYGDPTE